MISSEEPGLIAFKRSKTYHSECESGDINQ